MERKLFKSGNSVVVALPKEAIENLGLADGDIVTLEVNQESRQIVISPRSPDSIAGVDAEYARQVSEFIDEHRQALEILARQ
jgi:putative addiction module antidote